MPIAPENRHRYPPNWTTEIRPAILRRADYRCECMGECGRGHEGRRCPEVHLHRSRWGAADHTIVLTIAHLNHTPEDDRPDVLRAMCQGCHLHYDRDHHDQSRVVRWQDALEAAGHLTLFDGPAAGRNGASPPTPKPDAASVAACPNPPAGVDASRGLEQRPVELRGLSLLRLPDEIRTGLEAALALHAEYEQAGELVRATVRAALEDARAHGALGSELRVTFGLTKPRYYRLLRQASAEVERARGAATLRAQDTQEETLHAPSRP